GQGGHGTIQMAHWLNGNVRRLDHKNRAWERFPGFTVALKTLRNSRNPSEEFLNELKALHKCANEKLTHVVSVYGISQNPYTKEYIIVMEYMNKGHRPPIPDGIPTPYIELINECWDSEPRNRPSVEEIRNKINNWYYETKKPQSVIGTIFSDADMK
ncbi:26270_t:CDS:2, partial [Dentiscutata erythropus]